MSTNPPQPRTPAATRRHRAWIRLAAFALTLALAASVQAQVRRGGRRVIPDQPFETVWIVDRAMAEHDVWRALVTVTAADGFQPVVLHGGDDRWTPSLVHLLELLPQGDPVWVSDRETLFDVDDAVTPAELADADLASGPAVYSADAALDDIAAVIAMRLDGRLVAEVPANAEPSVLVGVERPTAVDTADHYLPTRDDAVAYANRLAGRAVVMVVRRGRVRPEHVLWAFQRGARILEVEPPPYDLDDAWSEYQAFDDVRLQIAADLPALFGDEEPEGLVIAGDWYEIPCRFPWGIGEPPPDGSADPWACPGCDNGVFEFSADLVYANLDHDSWLEPDVPVGRLMSPFDDLLALQAVIGIWSEHGAFAKPTDGVFLGLLGTSAPVRRDAIDAWRDGLTGLQWSIVGPDDPEPGYHLDRDAFFRVADRAGVVVVHGHGHPDYLSPGGGVFNQALTGTQLRQRAVDGVPSFWFLHACGTGKPDRDDLVAEQTLLVGLQSRLAHGALMAVENVASGSADPYWWAAAALEPGAAVGELVRRYVSAGASAYRDGAQTAPGLPAAEGGEAVKRFNGRGALMWVGDPLTPLGDLPTEIRSDD